MMAMYTGPAHGEAPRPFSHHERHGSYPIDRPSFGSALRPHIDLPRPLEARSSHILQPPVDDATPRRPDLFRGPAQQSDFRPPSHNLPRLQDILTSASPAPSPPAYNSSWNPNPAPPESRSNGRTHQSRPSYHAPAAHTAHTLHEPVPYQPPPGRRVDLPVLQTSPGTRHDSHSAVPPSPYGGHPESRDYASRNGERGQQTPAGPYPQHGTRSPYAPPGHDDPYYRSPALSMDRPGSLGYPNNPPAISSKYLGVRDIPGEGQFHVYEGGQRIPTAVDGETVNPAWGLTKANKPRKRLAMACLDCREKKIKCEPGAVSCLQCEKAKRVCRKAPAHQSQSDSISVSVWSNGARSPTRKSAGDVNSPNGLESDRELSDKRRTAEGHSPTEHPNKKLRLASPLYHLNGASAPVTAMGPQTSPAVQQSHGKALCWEEDPFAVDPEATMRLMEYYFQDVNNATYCMFPRNYFMHWLQTFSQKCQNERLVLYAMLAVGSVFSEDNYASFGKHCAHIAAEALHTSQGRFSLPLVQARLLLGLYNFAKGVNGTACDYISAGVHAATYLDYTTEHGCAVDNQACNSRLEFGFLPEQLVECRRRTMWSAFLMDRYCGGRSTFVNPQDMFLRLPCLDDMYERALRSDAPLFNNGVVDPVKCILTSTSPVAPMAWLCVMGGIWGDVANFVCRAVHRSPLVYEDDYEKFYEKTQRALQDWSLRLPEQLQFHKVNAELSMRRGYAGPFILMHLLYHLSFVKLNRFVKHSLIKDSLPRNVRATHRHSHELLQILSTIRTAKMEMMKNDGHMVSFSFTMPFAGDAILAAVDVVGAGGLDTHLNTTLESISCGLECLRELARYWSSARDQDKACEKRYYQIQNVLKHPFTARSGCWLGREWGVHSSLEKEFSNEDDCIYGADDRVFFDALRDEQPISGGARVA